MCTLRDGFLYKAVGPWVGLIIGFSNRGNSLGTVTVNNKIVFRKLLFLQKFNYASLNIVTL
jgi:hypothetical protein